jgi:hypothetical protein
LTLAGVGNAIKLLIEGMSLPLALVGLLGVVLMRRCTLGPGWLLAAPAILIAGQFVLLAHDQPAEYGRFAVTLDVILALVAAGAVGSLPRWRLRIAGLLALWTTAAGLRYVANFVVDSTRISNRYVAAEILTSLRKPASVLAIWAEPAPYSLPPVDLFTWKIILLPRGTDPGQFHLGESVISVRPSDQASPASDDPAWTFVPISWANKPFEIIKR